MKLLLTLLLFASSIFASENFKKNTDYICLNTHTVQQGKTYDVKMEDALKNPFEIILKDDKLITKDKVEFTFKMQRGEMLSYSNQDLMLLLQGKLSLGLIPKKAKGSLQYYFQCKEDI
ncbi:hypothetical protein A9Q76_02960 [Arcobacter sp. 31_11_sub10_T18]|nr:hypothetical protein A9Q76_02960 [Arcobacter sp. 31_11_sub10_T18]